MMKDGKSSRELEELKKELKNAIYGDFDKVEAIFKR
jgi:hypothetical protein